MKLNTENNNCFTYSTDELLIELLGGVRIDTLDRMRVTMKVAVVNRKHALYNEELANLSVRHNLDLYNDKQVEKVRKTYCRTFRSRFYCCYKGNSRHYKLVRGFVTVK